MNTTQYEAVSPENTRPERKKASPVVAWAGMFVAFVLLANPMPMLFDFLPDAIAYLLILFALRRAVGEVDVFDDFKKTTRKLLLVSALKLPCFFIMLNVWGGDARQRSIVAVFTLCFSIIEFLYLRTWTHDLFDATARYGQRYNCRAALAETGRAYRLAPEKLETMTLIFFAVRSLLSCLPEMTLVPLVDSAASRSFNWNTLYPVCALAGAVAVLIFGVIWCCYVIAHIGRISRDKDAARRMAADITLGSRAERENDYRLIRYATYFLIGGVVLQIDLLFDNVNYIPDVLSALLFFAAGYTLFTLLGRYRIAYILPLVYAVSTLAYTGCFTYYYYAFDDADLAYRADGALAAYLPVVATSVLSSILLLVTCILLCIALREVVMRYTGITQGGLTARNIDERLRHATPEEEERLRGAYGAIASKTRRELKIKLVILTILGGVTACIELARDTLMLFAPPPMQGQGQNPDFFTIFTYGWTDTAIWVSVLVWLVFAYHVCSRMRREAELNLVEE